MIATEFDAVAMYNIPHFLYLCIMNKDDFKILLNKELKVLQRSFIDCSLNRKQIELEEKIYYKVDILKFISIRVNCFIRDLFNSGIPSYFDESGISQRYSPSEFENIIVSVRPYNRELKYKYIKDYPIVRKYHIVHVEVFELNSFLIQLGNGEWYKIMLNKKYLSKPYFPYYEAYEVSFLKIHNIPKEYTAIQLIDKISKVIGLLCSSVSRINDKDIDPEYWIYEFNNLIPHFDDNLYVTNHDPQLAYYYRGEFNLLHEYENLSYCLRHFNDSLLNRSDTISIRDCLINELQDYVGEFIDESNNDLILNALNQLNTI